MIEPIASRTSMYARADPILRRLVHVRAPEVVEVGTSGALMAEYLLSRRRDLMVHVDYAAPKAQ